MPNTKGDGVTWIPMRAPHCISRKNAVNSVTFLNDARNSREDLLTGEARFWLSSRQDKFARGLISNHEKTSDSDFCSSK